MNYYNKYLKYKNKYLKLKYENNQSGGGISIIEELENKANEGDVDAHNALDKQYKAFLDTTKYKELAEQANEGAANANYILGKLHEMTGDYQKALECYTLSSNKGYILASNRLSAMGKGQFLDRMFFSG